MGWWLGVMVLILGLCLGSFVNMLVYRTAVNYKLIKGAGQQRPYNKNRSFCDYCGKQLSWYENIPVFSWVKQKGKARCCGNPLPWEYPVIEMVMGIFFLIFWLVETSSLTLLQIGWGWVILTLMVFSAVFDLKYMILPDFSTYILIGLTIVNVNNWPSAIGASGFLGLLYLVTKGKGMGWGDVKLALFMGLVLGYPKIIVAFYVAFIVGAVVGVGLMIGKKKGRKSEIPFGPFLLLGVVVAWRWGESIIRIISN